MTKLEVIEKLIENITPGPWLVITNGTVVCKTGEVVHEWNHGVKSSTDVVCRSAIGHNFSEDDKKNFEFIAAAPKIVVDLLAAVRVMNSALNDIYHGSDEHNISVRAHEAQIKALKILEKK